MGLVTQGLVAILAQDDPLLSFSLPASLPPSREFNRVASPARQLEATGFAGISPPR